jgi:hypothetical protein
MGNLSADLISCSIVFITRIDKALWRQNHKGELEEAWKVRNSVVIEKELPKEYAFDDHFMEDTYTPRQYRKDKSMARKDPIAYCADRCVATGNCDIFEEIFDMSPEEVLKFCNDCVMSESEDPCDVPDAVWEKGFYNLRP